MRFTPLDAPFGARLHLETDASLDDGERESLRTALAKHGLLVVRDGPLDDARQIGSVEGAASRIKAPWLLVHGTTDDIVPLQDSLDIRAAATTPPELVELPGVDHCFVDHESEMTNAVVPWLASQF